HPFAFFLAKGWENTEPHSPLAPRSQNSKKLRAPSFRLFSGERVGKQETQSANSRGHRPAAVSQCLCPEADSAKWIFPQERATFHRVQKRIHSLRNRSSKAAESRLTCLPPRGR